MNIAYYPAGPRTVASSRMRVWRIADELTKMGHNVVYDWNEYFARGEWVDVIQKRPNMEKFMQFEREAEQRVVYDVDDYIQNLPVQYADTITVDTPYKRKLYPSAVVIPDALDLDADAPRKSAHAEHLKRAVWVGNPENSYFLKNAAIACERLGIELVVITDLTSGNYAYFDGVQGLQWKAETVDQEMIQADVALCPFMFDGRWSADWINSKSANKPLKAWGLGLPVVGTPIPSYQEAGLVYWATTVDEWIARFTELRSRASREADAERGWEIAQQYRADKVAAMWLEVFEGKV